MFPSRFAVAAVLSLAFACGAFAQTTASLTGTVTVLELPLPGVTITVSSPALQGTRSIVTGDSGAYELAALPPGDYGVEFTREGFATFRTHAALRLSQTARVDAEMLPEGSDFIVITAPAEPVLETPQVSTSLTLQQIERLPVPRNQLATPQFA